MTSKSVVSDACSASNFFLEALVEQGVEYIFGNLGTDHAPLIEELARWRAEGRATPKVVLCPHESTAVHMAGGYAMATGRGQAAMVHVDAGTANSAMSLHNLLRARVPVMLMAGRAPFSSFDEMPGGRDSYVHFVQEPFDQGSLVRPYVKWEYTLPSGLLAHEVVARAATVMHSDPPGPVYLMLPREVLAAPCESASIRRFPTARHGPVKHGGATPAAIREMAERLMAAQEPLLITAYAGRQAQTPLLIDRLARLAGIRVCEFNPTHLNISRESPCFAGFKTDPFVRTTDCGLLVDVDVPWIPKYTTPNPDAFWIQIDVDAAKRTFPMWGFPTDLRYEGDSALILEQLIEAIEDMATPAFRERAALRVQRMGEERAKATQALADQAAEPGTIGNINVAYLCAAIGRALDPEDIVLNEAIRNTMSVFEHIPRSLPNTLVGLSGGGLGFSGGMGLGYKLAHPDRRVVHVIGDGSFHFSNPTSTYTVARQYKLPLLTVVLDNGGWQAVKESTLRMYPDGHAKVRNEFESTLGLESDFAKVAESAGAFGEILTDPSQVDAAIKRCLAALEGGRAAVLQVAVGQH